MPEYLMLCKFTEKGVANIKDSPKRIKSIKQMMEAAGSKFKSFYAALGRIDTVCLLEAPDDETVARLSLQISSQGNVHIETLRLFAEDQYTGLIDKIK